MHRGTERRSGWQGRARLVAMVAVGTLAAWPSSVSAAQLSFTTPGVQTPFTVPAGVCGYTVVALGGSGGAGNTNFPSPGAGGLGARRRRDDHGCARQHSCRDGRGSGRERPDQQ